MPESNQQRSEEIMAQTPRWAKRLERDGKDWRQVVAEMLQTRSRTEACRDIGITTDTLRRHYGSSRGRRNGLTVNQWAESLGMPRSTFLRWWHKHGPDEAIRKARGRQRVMTLPKWQSHGGDK